MAVGVSVGADHGAVWVGDNDLSAVLLVAGEHGGRAACRPLAREWEHTVERAERHVEGHDGPVRVRRH